MSHLAHVALMLMLPPIHVQLAIAAALIVVAQVLVVASLVVAATI